LKSPRKGKLGKVFPQGKEGSNNWPPFPKRSLGKIKWKGFPKVKK